ncbi:S8 family serine peptidase [Corynebacterium riegelii]|uniref:S8 family serine peptidase n=1 Tax=Corynebacterium riegelii TaxID=156976 RepID=UPI00191EE6E1|nr:S8 family serine peptidase [Corynebacterium riegelii]QQU84885.1 S8 family serine peptidase [Corynebacterium riegelii]
MRARRCVRAGALAAALAALALSVPAFAPVAAAQDYACAVPAHLPADMPLPAPGPERHALHRFATGAGVRVAVIDTGVAHHPELDQLIAGRDFVDAGAPNPFADCDSHGTIVAGIIAGTSRGIAPHAEIISIRQTSAHYRNRAGDAELAEYAGTLETLAAAIHNALDEHARVINISVVSCLPPEVAQLVDMAPINDALMRAEHSGAVVIAAAGNTTEACEQGFSVIPAHSPTVIAVGARATNHALADYSITVPGPFVSADGTVSYALASDGAGWATGTVAGRDRISQYVGTSFAAPRVTGSIALLLQRYPYLSPHQVRELVFAAAEPGHGAIDPMRVISQLPPETLEEQAPVLITPAAQERSLAPGRGLIVIAGALLLAGVITIARSLRR